ncbi:MAG: 6-phosphofructokinase [bacterium]|nr:6-phosphofructokinase [bacterium]
MLKTPQRPTSLAVLTSGGDAAGMNAAVRAVVRAGLDANLTVYTVYEGFQGLVDGGESIKLATSESVGGILHQGGTVLGTARCQEFREPEGRRRAAKNLVELGVDALVVIGGDGSLTGANLFKTEWKQHLKDLVEAGEVPKEMADAHRRLTLVGMVGSIDNDMFGTDMTIGADTALHRITEAIDAIHSTASSHQRAFVVEVMGRNCGYLALMSAVAAGANWVLIPENPPEEDDWEESMMGALKDGRSIGRRLNIVIVAEGAQDKYGNPITADHVSSILSDRLGEDTRVTSLGHVQRGGAPSAFDRYLSTVLGYAAVEQIVTSPGGEAQLIGLKEHQIISSPLMECVEQTQAVAERIAEQDYETAMEMRGGSFGDSFRMIKTMVRAKPHAPDPEQRRLRLGILHAGGPAPGMNPAVRVAVRVGIDKGHTMFGIRNGFRGFEAGDIEEMDWMSVNGWASRGGAELGTSRHKPRGDHFTQISENIEKFQLDGLLMIGGWAGYLIANQLKQESEQYPELDIPVVCLPAAINNDLPGSELAIGADTALNNIVADVDKIKQSAVASGRCFVVEVMGRDCGYLALMSGLATGAERVYLPEEGISLRDLESDVSSLKDGFRRGKRLGLVITTENADPVYDSGFIKQLFERESEGLFSVRQSILGHIQQGGDPSPFDRIQSTRFASKSLDYLIDQALSDSPQSAFMGLQHGKIIFTPMTQFPDLIESDAHRPTDQSWLSLMPLAKVMGRPGVPAL